MSDDRWLPFGAAAGAAAVVLFLAGALVIGDQPAFDASGAEIAAHVEDKRTRIQIACALNAIAMPLLVWFLATVASLTRAAASGARRAAALAYGCGLAFVALFLVDNTALAVSALRPANLTASPELATALRDLEWLSQGMAAPIGASVLAAIAVLALRHSAIWPRWVGWMAAVAALAYLLRVGVLFTPEEPFSASGLLGLWVPVTALAASILVGSTVLAIRVRNASRAGDQALGSSGQ